ncbi:hypothetical protein GQ42DRAFT_152804 [Ramicandelaber brevisporus]|nr:hypothetical protein GQ42DRAFT_152804 [Ramicandelaber brevisporus]
MYAEEENDEEDGTGAVLMSEMLNAEEGDGDGMSPGGGSGGGINGIGPVRPKELQPITFADFVATIEGMGVPSGSIFILTTNHPEKLNPALFQDGRIDLSLGLGYCTHYQISHMYGFVIGATHIVNEEITERESALKRDLKLAKKQVHSKFKRVLNNPNISAREKIRREMQRDQMVQIRLDLIRKRYNDDVLRGRKSIKLHQMPKEMYNEMVDTIPEYVIAPCKAMQVMLANRHTPDRIIPELAKLVPRQKTK